MLILKNSYIHNVFTSYFLLMCYILLTPELHPPHKLLPPEVLPGTAFGKHSIMQQTVGIGRPYSMKNYMVRRETFSDARNNLFTG
jgi:hypothetical protein